MYEQQPVVTERPDALRRLWATCARSAMSRASTPAWQLERWKVVRDLIVAWYGDTRSDDESIPEIVESQTAWMDPVQRSVVERLFAGWRAMYPKDPAVAIDLDPPAVSVVDDDAGVELRVSPTIGLEYADGTVEHVRLRTGRFGTGPDDAAVADRGSDATVVCVDAMVAHGTAEEISVPDDADERIAQLVDLARRDTRVPLNPGIHCFGCESASRCGQYPVVGEGRVFVSTRSIVVSKSQLAWLNTCERRVAWDRVYAVPTERDGDTELRSGLSAGLRFHELAAAALVSDDPDRILDDTCRTVDPSEAAELRRLWANHVDVWSREDRPEIRSTELPAGVTMLVPGVHVDSRGRETTQPVAITLIGILDATGRESDGTPMVVEHRTGRSGDHADLEPELYALSAAETIRRHTGVRPERLAIHLHHLRPEPAVCERRVFDESDLEAASERLRQAAHVVASWHPHDSLSPGFTVGPWCDGCHHRSVCENHR